MKVKTLINLLKQFPAHADAMIYRHETDDCSEITLLILRPGDPELMTPFSAPTVEIHPYYYEEDSDTTDVNLDAD